MVASAAVLLVCPTARAAVTTYVATLEGAQQVPPVTTTNSGTATLDYDDATRRLTGTITLSGFGPDDVTAVRIESGACGVEEGEPTVETLASPNAGVVRVGVSLDVSPLADEPSMLAAGNLYVNIRTVAHPDGELRGQLYPRGAAQTCGSSGGGDGPGSSGPGGGSGDGCAVSSSASPPVGVALLGLLGASIVARRRGGRRLVARDMAATEPAPPSSNQRSPSS